MKSQTTLLLVILCVSGLSACDNAVLNPNTAAARTQQRQEKIWREELEVQKCEAAALEKIAAELERHK